MRSDERSPLLQFPGQYTGQNPTLGDHHAQFCKLVGVKPLDLPHGTKHVPDPESLYVRAVRRRTSQSRTYLFTATLVNTLLLSQVVLGAALTGLGASDSSRVLITVFGALNTIIAGLVAFLKSRGQPVRARMFRDDLERVVDEIENSAVMWMGISKGVHGYDAIDTDDSVTVRSEVARLTRLYDRAVRTNTMNDPDMYAAGPVGDAHNSGLKSRSCLSAPAAAAAVVPVSATIVPPVNEIPAGAATATAPQPATDADESPASKAKVDEPNDKPAAQDLSENDKKPDSASGPVPTTSASPSAPPTAASSTPPTTTTSGPDEDESPATAARPQRHDQAAGDANGVSSSSGAATPERLKDSMGAADT